MRHRSILAIALVGMLGAHQMGWSLPSPSEPQSDRQSLRQLLGREPAAAQAIVSKLRGKYDATGTPFEVRVLQTAVSLEKQHPGLVFGILHQIVAEMKPEDMRALADTATALRTKYPQAPGRLAQLLGSRPSRLERLRQRLGALPAKAQLRSEILAYTQEHQPPFKKLLRTVSEVRDREFPKLGPQIRLELSRHMDKKAPELANLPLGPALRELAQKDPELLEQALRQILQNHGQEIRQAALVTLEALEKDPDSDAALWVSQLALELAQKHPEVARQVVDQRLAHRAERIGQVQKVAPGWMALARTTFESKDPQLRQRLRQAILTKYPSLAEEFETALDTNLPGLKGEVHDFIQSQSGSKT